MFLENIPGTAKLIYLDNLEIEYMFKEFIDWDH